MELNSILIVIGTLSGAIISAILTYVIQSRVASRQRRWSLEDESRKQNREREDEKRKLRQELLERKIKPIEEVINLMMNRLESAVALAVDIPVPINKEKEIEKAERINEMATEAWAAVQLMGLKELKEQWEIIAGLYWELEEIGSINPVKMDDIQKAHVEIVKILDDIRLST